MKNLQFMLWGLALAALTACVDLEEQLVGTVTTTYFTTPAGLEAAVDGDYAQLRDFFGREESFAVTEFGTDLTTDRKSTRLNSSHGYISYAVFCLKKKKTTHLELELLEHALTLPSH